MRRPRMGICRLLLLSIALAGSVHAAWGLTLWVAPDGNDAWTGRPADIKPLLDVPPEKLSDVTLVAYHSWEASRLRLAVVDGQSHTIIATGTWELTITLPGAPPRHFRELECRSEKWQRLDWLGFSSTATDTRVFYLDSMEIMPGVSEIQE